MRKFDFMNAIATGEIFKNTSLAMECREYAEEHKNDGQRSLQPLDAKAIKYIAELLEKKAMLAKEIDEALEAANIKVYGDTWHPMTESTVSKAVGLVRKVPNVKMKDTIVKGKNGKYVATLYYLD